MNTSWMRWMVLAFVAAVVMAAGAHAAVNTSTGSGNWTDAIWSDGVPTSDDDVYIRAGDTVTITGLATIQINSLTITGTLTHAANSTEPAQHKIVLDIAGNLSVPATGRIDVQAKGFSAQNGPGYEALPTSGGAHGGQGRGYNNPYFYPTGDTYGSVTNPTTLGSGGATSSGGGAVILRVAGSTDIAGAIDADGTDSGTSPGAGGSVFLTTGTLTGNGTIQANGYGPASGAGGGGRVAVLMTNGTDTGSVKLTAYGGAGGYIAAAGTVYVRTRDDTYGRLIVDNNGKFINVQAVNGNIEGMTGLDSPAGSTTYRFDRLSITNAGILLVRSNVTLDVSNNPEWDCDSTAGNVKARLVIDADQGGLAFPASYTFTNIVVSQRGTGLVTWASDITLGTNAVLTHEKGAWKDNVEMHKLNLRIAGDFTVTAGGAVDLTSCGYAAQKGPGFENAPSSIDAAGHGGEGRGYDGSQVRAMGYTYGSVRTPVSLGSGGNSQSGGGAAQLRVSGTCTVDGTISANAVNATKTGSGGSVFITAGSLAGSGAITADSYGFGGGGAGGGGRIAVVLTNGTDFGSVSFDANGGAGGGYNAAGGTIYLKQPAQTRGTLIVDNHTLATTSRTLITTNVTDAVVGTVDIRANGFLGVGSDATLSVQGSWTNNGDFAADDGGIVEFAGTDAATVVGDTTFARLVCTTATKRIDFQAGDTFTVSNGVNNGLLLAGAAGATNVLASTSPGTQWFLTLLSSAPQSVSHVAVSDSNADGGDPISTSDCRDDGNNSNWVFAVAGPIVWNGAVNADWGTGGNWDQGRTPIPSDTQVIISNVLNKPVLDADREIFNDLIIQSGANLSCGGWDLTVKGDADIDGTLTANGSETVTFKGDADFTGGSFVRAQSTVVLGGTAAQSFTAAGEAFDTLEIVNGAATVTLNGGLTAAYFLCDTAGASLRFEAGQTVAVTDLRLTGAAGNRITLRSTSDDVQWSLNVSGRQSVLQVDAKDSNASGETIYAMQSANSLNNDNWDFTDWDVWNGSASGDFADSNNWSDLSVPLTDSYVLINGNGGNAPVISSDTTVRRLTVGTTQPSTLTVNTNLTVTEDVLIDANGAITHTANPAGTGEPYKVLLTVGGDLRVLAGAMIDATAKGFPAQNGPGKTSNTYGGAAYGGQGVGYSGAVIPVGKCYGSFLAPASLGSGGNQRAGGGAIRLVIAGAFDLDGAVLAEADQNGNRTGSGGSIWITTGTLSGTGRVSVASYGAPGGGAGGGGRIAVLATNGTDHGAVTFSAKGGRSSDGSYRGAAGSVYLSHAGDPVGKVLIDNETVAQGAAGSELPPSTNAVNMELRSTPYVVTNTSEVVLTADGHVGDLLVYENAYLNLGSSTLYVDTFEHNLQDPLNEDPGTETNRVDRYEQIIWAQPPKGTVIVVR